MTQLQSKEQLYELPNGAILEYCGRELLKCRTKRDRYGSEIGIGVYDLTKGGKKQIRSVNDGVALLDENAVAFGGNPDSVTEIEHTVTDKEQLRKRLQSELE